MPRLWFQYRKRYGLHAISGGTTDILPSDFVSIPQAVWIACNYVSSFLILESIQVSIPQAVWIACNNQKVFGRVCRDRFQYRKRYGLHAMKQGIEIILQIYSFNTASGTDCMQ